MVTVALPRIIAPIATANGQLAGGKHTPVDATSTSLTMTLPSTGADGAHLSVAKWNTNANIVTVSGHIEGTAGSTRTLTLSKEVLEFTRGSGSWWVTGGNKTKTSLDTLYDAAGAATGAVATHASATDPHGDRAYALGLVQALPSNPGGGGTVTDLDGQSAALIGTGGALDTALNTAIGAALESAGADIVAQYAATSLINIATPQTITNSVAMTTVVTVPFAAEQLYQGSRVDVRVAGVFTNTSGLPVTFVPRLVAGTTVDGDPIAFPSATASYTWDADISMAVTDAALISVNARVSIYGGGTPQTWHVVYTQAQNTSSAFAISMGLKMGTAATTATIKVTAASALIFPPSASQAAPILWSPDYAAVAPTSSMAPTWFSEQEPNANGARDRIRIVTAANTPGTGKYKPTTGAMYVELRAKSLTNPGTDSPLDGDVQMDGSGNTFNRAECYDRYPTGTASSTPAANWPDPVGSTRWYGYSLYIPFGHQFTTSGTIWETITQIKGYQGGSPRIAIELKRNTLILGGLTGPSVPGQVLKTFPIDGSSQLSTAGGVWTKVVWGMKHGVTASAGWVNVFVDDVEKIPQYACQTMATGGVDGVDPTYLKMGIYRASAWTQTHTLHFSAPVVARRKADVEAKLATILTGGA